LSCLIEIDNLSYAYPDGREALHQVNLHVKHGERVGLVGPNGAGKTTLFLVLAGVAHPFDGSVIVAGCDIRKQEGRKEVHRKLGIVFQDTDDQLFNPTVFDDVAFGPLNLGLSDEEVHQRVESSLKQVGLDSSMYSRLPHHLSGGEKRRVAIAGILAMNPNVLLLDEPSSDLDPRGRRELIEIVNSLSITRIISSHDLEFVLRTCDKVIVFDEGTIVANGNASDILADSSIMMPHGLDVPISLQNR
jgi:cobalt/nickel transport system ATP-binding protein